MNTCHKSSRILLQRIPVLFVFAISFLGVASAQTGPGGVSATDGASALQLWYDAYDLDGDGLFEGSGEIGITSGSVTTWKNKSGHAGRDLSTGTFPGYLASHSGLNNMPVVNFDAASSHYIASTGNVQLSASGDVTLFFVGDDVVQADFCSLFNWRTAANVGGIVVEGSGATGWLSYSYNGSWPSILGTGYSNTNPYIFSTQLAAAGRNQFRDGTSLVTAAGLTVTNTSAPITLGRNAPNVGLYVTVKLPEVIVYNGTLNSAQQIIVNNYLAAKYGTALSANDIYTQDNAINGNFDFEVAGIGRVNSSNLHNSAKGSGLVHVLNPGGLGDNEFLFWGHNNLSTAAVETTDVPSGIDGRMARVWRVSETNATGTAVDVGAMDMRFDLTGLGTVNTTHLRLLVDTDNDGTFSDETPISGATNFSGNIYQFAGVTAIANGMRFTFATSNHATPLNGVRTFYSVATGAWESNTSWSRAFDGSSGVLSAGEFPARGDNVVIRAGNTITVNNVADNGSAGVKPDDLAKPNIGPFTASNLAMFYQTGNIAISGTLSVTGIEIMTGGNVSISSGGALTTSSSYVNTGYLEAASGSALSTLDDLILTGNSITTLNTSSISADDLIIDHTDATLCGTGTTTLQNGSGSTITFSNSGSINQVCTNYTIACTGSGCAGTFPTVGTTPVILGNTGPAGVGSATGSSSLILWFRTDNGITSASSLITNWTNSAGISATDVSEATSQRPTLVTNAVNGFSEVSFNGTNRLRSGLTLTTANFVEDRASSFIVTRAANTTHMGSLYLSDPLQPNRFSAHMPWGTDIFFDLGACCTGTSRISFSALTGLTLYSIWAYAMDPAVGKTVYRNESLQGTLAGTSTFTSPSSYRFNLGGNTTSTAGFQGGLTEVAIFKSNVNTAQRILIDNYLSAKYNLTLSANDIYTLDVSNDFDYDVAGIGMAADGTAHRDALGTGIVRMWNPNDLAAGEFLVWGSTNATLTTTTNVAGTTVDGTVIKERLTRIWGVTETGDVGTVSVSFNVGVFPGGKFTGSSLRLLVDHDGDGFADNDVLPIAGSYASNTVVFSYNFATGDRFTLGNTSPSQSLPIGLFEFDAKPGKEEVIASWTTLTETNNDFFSLERSVDIQTWAEVARVPGGGTTTEVNNYVAHDREPVSGTSYYRLRQTDFDDQHSYSKIVKIDFEGSSELTLSPNPSTGVVKIEGDITEVSQIKVLNVAGQEVPFEINTDHGMELNLTPLSSGMYLVKIVHGHQVTVARVVKY